MGRAIVRKPQVFLFDEPLSNLDAKLRGTMRLEMKKLHQRLGVTTVFVTHDQIEAMTLADRVVVMNGGRIEQIGTPDEVYHQPASLFVAGFIGAPTMNLLPARVRSADQVAAGRERSDSSRSPQRTDGPSDGRARHPARGCRCRRGAPPAGWADVPAVVEVVEPLGADTLVFTTVSGVAVTARVRPEVRPAPGAQVDAAAQPGARASVRGGHGEGAREQGALILLHIRELSFRGLRGTRMSPESITTSRNCCARSSGRGLRSRKHPWLLIPGSRGGPRSARTRSRAPE